MARIYGRAKRYDGTPAAYVLIYRWKDGKCLFKAAPDASGQWYFDYDINLIIGITAVADGCEPVTHGPYELGVSDI